MAPSLAFLPNCDFAHGVLRATVFWNLRHYEPEGLYTLCGSNCDLGRIRQGCTSSACLLNTCTLYPEHPRC